MLSKIVKFIGITLIGTGLFAALPFTGYAQYYGYGYGTPTVTTGYATNITPMNATLNGSVSMNGSPGNAWFEYGTDVNFGASTSLFSFIVNDGGGGNYSRQISGLSANTTYYFRAVAQNYYGKVYGNITTFTTDFSTDGNNNQMAPTAITTSGNVLVNNVAQFNSLILTGNGSQAESWFDWGETPDLGNQTSLTAVSGGPAVRHTNTITGLNPGTTYYFRARAQNAYGVSAGQILSLTTTGSAKTAATAPKTGGTAAGSAITSTDRTTVDKSVNTKQINSLSSVLGANAFSSGTFLPTSLLGWIVLVALILILVVLAKHTHREFSKTKAH